MKNENEVINLTLKVEQFYNSKNSNFEKGTLKNELEKLIINKLQNPNYQPVIQWKKALQAFTDVANYEIIDCYGDQSPGMKLLLNFTEKIINEFVIVHEYINISVSLLDKIFTVFKTQNFFFKKIKTVVKQIQIIESIEKESSPWQTFEIIEQHFCGYRFIKPFILFTEVDCHYTLFGYNKNEMLIKRPTLYDYLMNPSEFLVEKIINCNQ